MSELLVTLAQIVLILLLSTVILFFLWMGFMLIFGIAVALFTTSKRWWTKPW